MALPFIFTENVDYILHTLAPFALYQHVVPLASEQKCELRDVIHSLLSPFLPSNIDNNAPERLAASIDTRVFCFNFSGQRSDDILPDFSE